MKKYPIVLIILTAVLMNGCSDNNTPEASLSRFLDAQFANDAAAAYAEISAADKNVKSLQKYTEDLSNPFAALLAGQVTYEITSINVTGNEALADVAITAPDLSGMFGELMSAAFESAFSEDKESAMDSTLSKVAENASDKDLPEKTNHENYRLVLEDGTWRVYLGLKLDALLADAGEFRKNQELDKSLKAYSDALDLDSESVEAQEGFEEVQSEITTMHEQREYLANVQLYDFVAKYYESWLDDRVPGVRFKLRNDGDRTLNKVEVTVYFQDASGNAIAEEDYHPVLVTEYSFGDSKPLKPGYIWQMEKDRFYKAENVPSEWQEGKAVAKITEIEFAE